MSIFHFHLREGDTVTLDEDGRALQDLEAAVQAALEAARGLIAHAMLEGVTNSVGDIRIVGDDDQELKTIWFGYKAHVTVS